MFDSGPGARGGSAYYYLSGGWLAGWPYRVTEPQLGSPSLHAPACL